MLMLFHAHIIINYSVVHKSLLFRNEEKLVALLVYSSFVRVATSGFRVIPFPLVVVFVFRKAETPVALLVYSSFRVAGTKGFRIIPYHLVVEADCAQMRSDSGIISYSSQHCSTV